MAPRTVIGPGALEYLPEDITLPALRDAVQDCRGCPLYQGATQAVFGAGRASARLFIVGEQPGNEEDIQGKPFVGQAGRVLSHGLEAAGISRADAYVTNAVKHFKWTAMGQRRLHQKPTPREVAACLPWLEKELELVRPTVLLCLGATAAQALLGRNIRVTMQHGQEIETPLADHAVATIHPAAILRSPTVAAREQATAQFVADLRFVKTLLDR